MITYDHRQYGPQHCWRWYLVLFVCMRFRRFRVSAGWCRQIRTRPSVSIIFSAKGCEKIAAQLPKSPTTRITWWKLVEAMWERSFEAKSCHYNLQMRIFLQRSSLEYIQNVEGKHVTRGQFQLTCRAKPTPRFTALVTALKGSPLSENLCHSQSGTKTWRNEPNFNSHHISIYITLNQVNI